MTSKEKIRRSFTQVVAACAAALVLFAALGFLSFLRYQQHVKQDEREDLSLFAETKYREIANWRSERLSYAAALQNNPLVSRAAWQVRQGTASGQVRDELRYIFTDLRKKILFEDIYLADPEGNVLLASGRVAEPLGSQAEEGVRQAAKGGGIVFSELFRNDINGDFELDLYVPFRRTENSEKIFAVAVLRTDPEAILFPLLSLSHGMHHALETFLVENKGSDVRLLTGTQDGRSGFLSPLVRRCGRGCIDAILNGRTEQKESRDYRGTPVLVDVRPFPGSDWFLVTKADLSKSFENITHEGLLITVTVVLCLLLVCLFIGLVWYRQHALYYRKQYEAETMVQSLRQRYDSLMRYANDIVILTDEQFAILDVNERAVTQHGYNREELLGMNLRDLRPPHLRPDLERIL
ncbi:MAG: PAS domain S-box protein, partial [Endomicrobiales bacterium]